MSEEIASLIDALENPDRAVVRAAVDSLVALGPRPEVVEALNRSLNNSNQRNRWPIAYTLAQLVPPPSLCLEVLLEGLGAEDKDIRWATQALLARLGERDERIVGEVVRLLKKGSSNQRRMAVYCLRGLHRQESFMEPLLECLEDPDLLVRVAAITALAEKRARGEVSAKLELLASQDPDNRVRNAATFALQRWGSPSERPQRGEGC